MADKIAWIEGLPDADGDSRFFRVGERVTTSGLPMLDWPEVTEIVMSDDVPGSAGDLRRVRVYAGPKMIFEAPYSSLGGIGYI